MQEKQIKCNTLKVKVMPLNPIFSFLASEIEKMYKSGAQ